MKYGFGDKELLVVLPMMRKRAWVLTKNEDRANDLVQATIVQMLTHRRTYVSGTNLQAWMCVVMRNVHYDQERRRRKLAPNLIIDDTWDEKKFPAALIEYPNDTITAYEAHEAVDILNKRRFEMSAAHWDAMIMVLHNGMTYEEAAAKTQMKIGTVKSRVNRARAAVRKMPELA